MRYSNKLEKIYKTHKKDFDGIRQINENKNLLDIAKLYLYNRFSVLNVSDFLNEIKDYRGELLDSEDTSELMKDIDKLMNKVEYNIGFFNEASYLFRNNEYKQLEDQFLKDSDYDLDSDALRKYIEIYFIILLPNPDLASIHFAGIELAKLRWSCVTGEYKTGFSV